MYHFEPRLLDIEGSTYLRHNTPKLKKIEEVYPSTVTRVKELFSSMKSNQQFVVKFKDEQNQTSASWDMAKNDMPRNMGAKWKMEPTKIKW